MMHKGPFAAAKAMLAAISAAMQMLRVDDRQHAISQIPRYRSRGHGRGTYSYAHGRGSRGGNNMPHQGVQECLRRLRGGWARGYDGPNRITKRQAVELLNAGTPFSELAQP